ncbi:hypothetical protein Tco_1314140 [Tanacetum coccineum]
MIASSSSRYSSNDMVHNHYLEEAKKKTQEIGRNSEPSVMHSARSQSTANDYKPKPRRNNQTSRNWLASKSSFITTKTVPIAKHSRNSRNFSDSKHFVCSTCQKCVFNANHDSCVTKFLNEVNSRAKVPSNKATNKNKLVERISVPKKQERHILTGHRFSIKKTSVVHEKTSPGSYLRWKQMGRIFNTVGLRWVPTGKIFTSSTTTVDSELPNGFNTDITNLHECIQSLDSSAGTSISVQEEQTLDLNTGTPFNLKKERIKVWIKENVKSGRPRAVGKNFTQGSQNIFLTQSKSQSQSEGPKEESNSSPHSLWTVFQGNLKFVQKGKTVEVFGMAIPDPLITEAIQQSPVYPSIMVKWLLRIQRKPLKKVQGEQPQTNKPTPQKPPTTTPVKPSKPAPAPTKKPSKHKLPRSKLEKNSLFSNLLMKR